MGENGAKSKGLKLAKIWGYHPFLDQQICYVKWGTLDQPIMSEFEIFCFFMAGEVCFFERKQTHWMYSAKCRRVIMHSSCITYVYIYVYPPSVQKLGMKLKNMFVFLLPISGSCRRKISNH